MPGAEEGLGCTQEHCVRIRPITRLAIALRKHAALEADEKALQVASDMDTCTLTKLV